MTETLGVAKALRETVLNERSIAFDIASRAYACRSHDVLTGHESKVRERLEQCTPETRAFLECLWQGWRRGGFRDFTGSRVQASLPNFSVHHWLFEAVRGLADESQAAVIPELLEHFQAAYEATEQRLAAHVRQHAALEAMGDSAVVNAALKRVHLTETEKQQVLTSGISVSKADIGISCAFLWAASSFVQAFPTQKWSFLLFVTYLALIPLYLFWRRVFHGLRLDPRQKLRASAATEITCSALLSFPLAVCMLNFRPNDYSAPMWSVLVLQGLLLLLAAGFILHKARLFSRKLKQVDWLQ